MFSGIEYTSLVDSSILYAEYCHRYILTKMVPAGKELLDIWLVASKAIQLGIVLDKATTITFAAGHQLDYGEALEFPEPPKHFHYYDVDKYGYFLFIFAEDNYRVDRRSFGREISGSILALCEF